MTRTVYVDLDYTIGFYDAASDHWVVYDGTLPALQNLKAHARLVLLTANRRDKVEKLFQAFPDLAALFVQTITCEDFAPHFVRITARHIDWVRTGRVDSKTQFLSFVHQLWEQSPAEVLPDGMVSPIAPPLAYEDWQQRVYFPFIAPNKAAVCGRTDLLVDDEFSVEKPNPIYRLMIDEGRALYAGKRGGITATEGPDWARIGSMAMDFLTKKKQGVGA